MTELKKEKSNGLFRESVTRLGWGKTYLPAERILCKGIIIRYIMAFLLRVVCNLFIQLQGSGGSKKYGSESYQ